MVQHQRQSDEGNEDCRAGQPCCEHSNPQSDQSLDPPGWPPEIVLAIGTIREELAQFGGDDGPKSGPVAYTEETHETATDFKRVPLEILSQEPTVQADGWRSVATHDH